VKQTKKFKPTNGVSNFLYFRFMSNSLTKEKIIAVLREQKDFLQQQFFVSHIGIFGSFARNEANDNSDIDFLVEINAPLPIYRATKEKLREYLKATFGREVDLANPDSLKPHYKARIQKQAIYA
jgi:uncharacterized protein